MIRKARNPGHGVEALRTGEPYGPEVGQTRRHEHQECEADRRENRPDAQPQIRNGKYRTRAAYEVAALRKVRPGFLRAIHRGIQVQLESFGKFEACGNLLHWILLADILDLMVTAGACRERSQSPKLLA